MSYYIIDSAERRRLCFHPSGLVGWLVTMFIINIMGKRMNGCSLNFHLWSNMVRLTMCNIWGCYVKALVYSIFVCCFMKFSGLCVRPNMGQGTFIGYILNNLFQSRIDTFMLHELGTGEVWALGLLLAICRLSFMHHLDWSWVFTWEYLSGENQIIWLCGTNTWKSIRTSINNSNIHTSYTIVINTTNTSEKVGKQHLRQYITWSLKPYSMCSCRRS